MKGTLAGLLLTCLLLGACTYNPPAPPKQRTHDRLQSMVGRLTIEQAFTHLGPPARCGDAGQVRTCLWVRGSATNVAVPLGGYWVNQTIPPRTMTLTFLNGVLSNYRLTGDWE